MTLRYYYVSDRINGAYEGPLTKSEAEERLNFWINDRFEREKAMAENGLSNDDIAEKVRGFYSIVKKGCKYGEVTIPESEWKRINSDPSGWYLNLWAWLLGRDYNPLDESEVCDYGLKPFGDAINGEMYFEDMETGVIYIGKLGESVSADGSKIYMFMENKNSNEISSSDIR